MKWMSHWFRRPAAGPLTQPVRLCLESLEERTVLSGSVPTLGAAASFALLGINGGQVIQNSSSVVGNVGLGPNETSTLQKTIDTGTLYVDPTATLSYTAKDFSATGGIVAQDLSQAASDANAASAAYAALSPTVSLGDLTRSLTLQGNGGVNVINLSSLNYNSQTLTLSGSAADVFIFNVYGGFTFAQSSIVLSGGVTANQVLFNFPTAGPTVDLFKSTNVIVGTFLAPYRSMIYDNPASFTGAMIAQNIDIHSGADLTGATFVPPAPAPSSLSGFVYADNNSDGVFDAGDTVLTGATVTLTGTNDMGQSVTMTATTDENGFYSFSNLRPGTYTITETPLANFQQEVANVGSVGGSAAAGQVSTISLGAGINGVNYDFGQILSGGGS